MAFTAGGASKPRTPTWAVARNLNCYHKSEIIQFTNIHIYAHIPIIYVYIYIYISVYPFCYGLKLDPLLANLYPRHQNAHEAAGAPRRSSDGAS